MERKHFLERLERENNYMEEYCKLERFCNTCYDSYGDAGYSINNLIDTYFWEWEDRGSFASFDELREYMGFGLVKKGQKIEIKAKDVDINGYFSFCEMILTLLEAFRYHFSSDLHRIKNAMVKTMQAVIENAGFEMKIVGREIRIVEKNAVAAEVADIVPDIADIIIEYNHYLLRGNIEKKRVLLKQIADALEPKRKTLDSMQSSAPKDFFDLVNEMNIRHNNLDPSDTRRYNAVFASYTPAEREKWYDLLYEQALGLFVMLNQLERNKAIKEYKQARVKAKEQDM